MAQLKPPLPTPTVTSSSAAQAFSAFCFPCPASSSPSKSSSFRFFSTNCRHRSPFLGSGVNNLCRTRSLGTPKASSNGRRRRKEQGLRRTLSSSASMDGDRSSDIYDDDEVFLQRLKEIAISYEREEQFYKIMNDPNLEDRANNDASSFFNASSASPVIPSPKRPLMGSIQPEPRWQDEPVPAIVERRANSFEIPFSLRIIKRKMKWEEGMWLKEAGDSASTSVKKAFSSMVFMIREMQSFTVQMRESLLTNQHFDLESVLSRVHHELHASFVWLFQQIFSSTPALMLSLMLLLANFTVHSMASTPAIAATTSPTPPATTQVASLEDTQTLNNPKINVSSIKTYSFGKTASVGGCGGGGKIKPVAGATDDGRSGGHSFQSSSVIPDHGLSNAASTTTGPEEEVIREAAMSTEEEENEDVLWNRVVDEARSMQESTRHKALMDDQTLNDMVAPVRADLEQGLEHRLDYGDTEILYHNLLAEDPDNPLLLCNFAQFLYLVQGNFNRAEEYFERAVKKEPKDAEALSRYASFLWMGKKDIAGAEEKFLEAMDADPGNPYHTATYANFLWNTGGEDTCYPIY